MHLADLNGIRQSYSSTFISHTLVVLLAALACVSCSYSAASSDQPGAGEEERQEETAAEQATTPLIELGEFDGESEDFELFDPCTEIPWEVYQAVGFVEEVGERFYDPGRSSSCTFKSNAEKGRLAAVRITGDKVPFERIVEFGLLLNANSRSTLPDVYHFWLGSDQGDNCTAAIHTTNGRLTVNYFDRDLQWQQDSLCTKANEYLERIHELTGGV